MITLCICGSREFKDKEFLYAKVDEVIAKLYDDYVIIEGGAEGADALAIEYANDHNTPYAEFKADWETFGKSAGPIRNKHMAEAADVVVAFKLKNKKCKGTNNMIEQSRRLGKQVYIFER